MSTRCTQWLGYTMGGGAKEDGLGGLVVFFNFLSVHMKCLHVAVHLSKATWPLSIFGNAMHAVRTQCPRSAHAVQSFVCR